MVKRHCDSAKHKNALVGVSAQPKISFIMATVSESEKVLRSELYSSLVLLPNITCPSQLLTISLGYVIIIIILWTLCNMYKVLLYVVLIIAYSRCQKFISIKENGENSRKF